MKICAIICEYNPFHNGHLHQIRQIRDQVSPDAILCIMSGNFVQRGDCAVMEKHTRAKHAVLAGADAVIELPTVFATSNAELFAKGAISILKEIPEVTTLCFGAENADKPTFLQAAKLLNQEPEEVSFKIKTLMSEGISYAKARAQAFEGYIPSAFLSSPNNVLGLEYTKAILDANAAIDIFPIPRIGGGYLDEKLQEVSSATAIRKAITNGETIKNTLPLYVQKDLPNNLENSLHLLEKHAVLFNSKEEIANICDCVEGLENAFKKMATSSLSFEENLTSQRYTSSRIRRIALQNLLGISKCFIKDCLTTPLYIRALAMKKSRIDLLSILGQSKLSLLIRAHDEDNLQGVQKACYEKDIYAEQMYSLLYGEKTTKTIFVD